MEEEVELGAAEDEDEDEDEEGEPERAGSSPVAKRRLFILEERLKCSLQFTPPRPGRRFAISAQQFPSTCCPYSQSMCTMYRLN
jgi:hypothetical protein